MPDITPYQQQVSASNQTRVGRVAQPTEQPDIGGAIQRFGEKLETARAKSEIVRSESELRRAYDGIYRELEQDGEGDYSKFEERFTQKAQEIRSKVLGSLKTETARTLMGERAVGMEDNYTIQVRSLQRARGVDEVRSTVAGKIDEFKEAADNTSLPMERLDALRKETDAYVADMHRNGFVDKVGMETYRQEADKLYDAGRVARAQDVLDAAETEEQAKKVFEQFEKQSDKDGLKTYWKSVQSDRRTKQNVAEAEQRKAEIKAANTFEMDVLHGKVGYRDLQKAVNRGDISINDQPALYRSIRAEQDRLKTEAAAAAKLTEAQKEEWKTWSNQAVYSLQSSSTMTPAQFMLDPETQWDPQLYELYKHLTPEDQREIDRKRLEMRETGKSNNEVDRIETMLLDEAKRIAPANWKVGSEAKDKTKESIELAGYLRQAATEMAPQTGGAKLTPDDVRRAAAFAMGRMKAGENLPVVQWETYAYDVQNSDMTDKALYADVFERLRAKTGTTPSMADVRAAYEQAQAALQ